jgi:exopolysaccharide production protein ExoQ
VSTQKNGLGVLTLVCALFLIWRFLMRWRHRKLKSVGRGKIADACALFIALWLIKGPGTSYSATAASSLIMGTAVLILLLWLEKIGRLSSFSCLKMVAIPCTFAGIAIPLAGGGGLLSEILALIGRDPTFTGRTDIWGLLLPIAWRHPVLGLGYGSFWIDPPLPAPFNLLTHSHNGYVEVFLELGVIGVLLIVCCVWSFLRQAQTALTIDCEWAAFIISTVLILLFHNITESSFVRASSFLWSVTLIFAVLLPRLGDMNHQCTKAAVPLENLDPSEAAALENAGA